MSWAIFVWTVLPPGAVLCAMLASGWALPMAAASRVLNTPIRIGSLQLSVAVFMTALCGTLATLSYSGMRRSEARREEMEGSALAHALALQDQQQRNYFQWGRNYYLTLLGLTLWLTAWRLKFLYDQQQLTPRQVGAGRSSGLARAFYVAVGVLAFLAADVPVCRINYTLNLATFVTPQKAKLQRSVGPCEASMLATASGPCAEFCEQVRKLSEERLASIRWARNWHVLGRLAATLFDEARGVEQGEQRIQELFQKRTCAQVLKSVDKSNQMVNWICVLLAGVSIIGAFVALSNASEGTWYGAWGGADWYHIGHED